jgi:hypothetical protein
MNAPDDRAVAEEQSRRQRDRAIEIIADAMDEYGMGYWRMTEQPTAGEVAAELWETWAPHQRAEPLIESDYAVTGLLNDVSQALNAHGLDTYEARCAEIGRRLVESAMGYIFSVHAMSDAEEAEQLLAQRRREYMRTERT